MSHEKDNNYWETYWASQTDGKHRSSSESFLKKEAEEKLLHMPKGESLLDFGCGSGELLVYYSQCYAYSLGVDASKSMLEVAEEKMAKANLKKTVVLLNLNDREVWDYLRRHSPTKSFDCITAGQVLQYLDQNQVDNFIRNAVEFLAENGRISLFDIVHKRLYPLWKSGFLNGSQPLCKALPRLALIKFRGLRNRIKRKPFFNDGYLYLPEFFRELAEKYDLEIEVVNSIYYEYRYHVFLSKKPIT